MRPLFATGAFRRRLLWRTRMRAVLSEFGILSDITNPLEEIGGCHALKLSPVGMIEAYVDRQLRFAYFQSDIVIGELWDLLGLVVACQ